VGKSIKIGKKSVKRKIGPKARGGEFFIKGGLIQDPFHRRHYKRAFATWSIKPRLIRRAPFFG
jgi:hypothetical protein